MIDLRTGVLVATAIGGPWLLGAGGRAGIPIPVYVTGGQKAAISALPASIGGYTHQTTGNPYDDQSLIARVGELGRSLVKTNGAEGALAETPKASSAEVMDMLQRLVDAANAGLTATDEPYTRDAGGDLGAALDTARAIVAGSTPDDVSLWQTLTTSPVDAFYGAFTNAAPDDTKIINMWRAARNLAGEMDSQGLLSSGKPFTPTVAGGLSAAADAVGNFVEGIAGKGLGVVANGVADLVLSTPGLLLISGLLIYKVVTR